MVFRSIIKILVVLFVVIAFMSMSSKESKECNSPKLLNPADSTVVKQRLLLKNAAFCSCLNATYPTDSILRGDGSLSGYFQIGSYGTNTFLAINEEAKKYIITTKDKYNSIKGKPLGMMKCLDWYNSMELDSLVKSYDNDIILYPPLDHIENKK